MPTRNDDEAKKIQLGPVQRTKTYELVVNQIKNEIFAGRLRPGDRLPGERQLSELLQVSRPSVFARLFVFSKLLRSSAAGRATAQRAA